MTQLNGKVALVTGGGYGMGRAAAQRFASCGARVAVADIDVSRGAETVSLIEKDGGSALFIEADVSSAAAVAIGSRYFGGQATGCACLPSDWRAASSSGRWR